MEWWHFLTCVSGGKLVYFPVIREFVIELVSKLVPAHTETTVLHYKYVMSLCGWLHGNWSPIKTYICTCGWLHAWQLIPQRDFYLHMWLTAWHPIPQRDFYLHMWLTAWQPIPHRDSYLYMWLTAWQPIPHRDFYLHTWLTAWQSRLLFAQVADLATNPPARLLFAQVADCMATNPPSRLICTCGWLHGNQSPVCNCGCLLLVLKCCVRTYTIAIAKITTGFSQLKGTFSVCLYDNVLSLVSNCL
jgi:hypothetical protein